MESVIQFPKRNKPKNSITITRAIERGLLEAQAAGVTKKILAFKLKEGFYLIQEIDDVGQR